MIVTLTPENLPGARRHHQLVSMSCKMTTHLRNLLATRAQVPTLRSTERSDW